MTTTVLCFLIAFSMKGIGNERFSVYYPAGYRNQAEWTLFYLERYYRHADRLTGNRPRRLYVVIEDIGAESNGITDPVAGALHLYARVPYPDFRFGATRSWWRTLSVHEYAHYSHLTSVRGPVKYLRYLFGKAWLPNTVSALYMYEGVTVLTESSILPYEGRLNDGYFDAYTDLCAADRRLPAQNFLAHVPDAYPGGTLPYLLGGQFIEHLAGGKALALADSAAAAECPLGQYITHYGGCNLLNIFGYDYSARRVWNHPRHRLYQEWRRGREGDSRYRRVSGRPLTRGYALSFTAAADSGLYIYRRVDKPLAHDYALRYGELQFVDLRSGVCRSVLKGNILLPLRTDQGDLYVGMNALRPGYKNYSLDGYGYAATILRIQSGRKKKIFTGAIRAFAVRGGTCHYSRDRGAGSEIYINGRLFHTLDSLLVQDLTVRDNGDLVFIGYQEGDGNDLYLLTGERILHRLTDHDCSLAGLSLSGTSAYFSANESGIWQPYRYDLETGALYLLAADNFAAYPARVGDNLYYVTIDADGEVLKETEYGETPVFWPKDRIPVPFPEPAPAAGRSPWRNIWSLLWPDASLPYYLPATDSDPATIGGIIIGHDALGRHEYSLLFDRRDTWHADAIWAFRCLPPVTMTVRGSDDTAKSAAVIDYLAWRRDNGFIRGLRIGVGCYPFIRELDGRISASLRPEVRTELGWFAQVSVRADAEARPAYQTGIAAYQPIGIGVIVPQILAGYAAESLIVGFPSGGEISGRYGLKTGLRLTMPLAAPRWGVDFPHFFLERIWGSGEVQWGAAADTPRKPWNGTRCNLLAYITFNVSALSGFLKTRLSLGAAYDPAEPVVAPYVRLKMEILDLLDRMNERMRAARRIDAFPDPGR